MDDSQLLDSDSTTPPMVRFGVLGTGRITRRLVADLQQSARASVTAIASRDEARAKWYAGQYGIPLAMSGYESLLHSPEVDAVYIALPPSEHAAWAIAAAQAGKHVLCEKPLTLSAGETKQLDQACRYHQVKWLDATGWVHHARTSRMADLIRAGRLGRVQHASSSVSFYQPFQSGDHRLDPALGGGCLLDLGWYATGIPVWAAGDARPVSVFAIGDQHEGVWWRVSALLRFDSGMTASAHCAYDVATRKWMEVAGDEASIVCDDFTRPWLHRPTRFWVHDRAGEGGAETIEGHQELAMIQAFCDEIQELRSLTDQRRQAMTTQSVLTALELSLAERQEIAVDVDPITDEVK